jgi:hypothetical protein
MRVVNFARGDLGNAAFPERNNGAGGWCGAEAGFSVRPDSTGLSRFVLARGAGVSVVVLG